MNAQIGQYEAQIRELKAINARLYEEIVPLRRVSEHLLPAIQRFNDQYRSHNKNV